MRLSINVMVDTHLCKLRDTPAFLSIFSSLFRSYYSRANCEKRQSDTKPQKHEKSRLQEKNTRKRKAHAFSISQPKPRRLTYQHFFISLIILALLSRSTPSSNSDPGSHIAGPPPPSPLRNVPSFLSRA